MAAPKNPNVSNAAATRRKLGDQTAANRLAASPDYIVLNRALVEADAAEANWARSLLAQDNGTLRERERTMMNRYLLAEAVLEYLEDVHAPKHLYEPLDAEAQWGNLTDEDFAKMNSKSRELIQGRLSDARLHKLTGE